jgi:hypothetical protein
VADQEPHEFLRALDQDLASALELVVRDVMTSGASEEVATRWVWRYAERHCDWVDSDESAGEIAVAVAALLQETIMESGSLAPRHPELPSRNTFPTCPMHPNHPLWLSADGYWRCAATHSVVAQLGGLTGRYETACQWPARAAAGGHQAELDGHHGA